MNLEKVILKIERFCAYRDRSVFEVKEKMYQLQIDSVSVQERIIKSLQQDGFLNEKRFAETFVHGKFYFKQWGRMKITMALRQKRIDEQLIADALRNIPEKDYQDIISALIEKKKKELKLKKRTSSAEKYKLIYFLQSKGFEIGEILEVLKTL